MNELFQHPKLIFEVLAAYWAFSALVSGMPDPPQGSFFYAWLYHSLHAFAGNLTKFADSKIQAMTSTTTTVKVEESKTTEKPEVKPQAAVKGA